MTLEQAITEFYTKTKVEKLATSTRRLRALAEWCVEELEKRGLPGAVTETSLPGCGRSKQWDVAWVLNNKPRLAISLKSLLENLSGCVPNRIDDLIGECANAQMILPELAVGYICVFDTARDTFSSKHGMTWLQVFEKSLRSLDGRTAPFWTPGTIESFLMLAVDFSSDAKLLTPYEETNRFFDTLVQQVRMRNPDIG